MSRADGRTIPPPPRVGRVLRAAIADLYYNSWRFLAANMVIGAAMIVIVLAAVGTAWALVLLPLAAVPAAGMMRMSTMLIRNGHADFGDVIDVMRRPWMALAVATAQLLVALVLLVDMWLGAAIGSGIGLVLTVSALYGLVIGWAYAATAWPLLMDPERDADSVAARLRLAALVLLAHPIRVGAFLLAAGIVLALSALAIAPFISFSVALVWLVVARFVLPVADRIEGRPTVAVEA